MKIDTTEAKNVPSQVVIRGTGEDLIGLSGALNDAHKSGLAILPLFIDGKVSCTIIVEREN